MNRLRYLSFLVLAVCAVSEAAGQSGRSADDPPYDLLIRGGQVIDGTGQPARKADVAIRADRVVKVGDLAEVQAQQVIDATELIIAPGFIDLHSHAESGLVSDAIERRRAPNLITQGITTVVVNQDGGGPLSLRDQRREMQRLGIGLNVAQVIGHGTVRFHVMRNDFRRPATAAEIERMRKRVVDAMQAGGFGLSAGLEYTPGRWSTAAEMEQLVAAIQPFGGVYILHERSSGSRPMWFLPSQHPGDQPSMLDNLQELVDVAAATQATVVATHIKARGTDFWGSSGKMIDLLEQARARGLSIYADQYAYNTSGSDGRIVLIPAWVHSKGQTGSDTGSLGEQTAADRLEQVLDDAAQAADLRRDIAYEIKRRGGPQKILIVEHPQPRWNGKSLSDFAASEQCDPVEAVIRLQRLGDRKRRGGARLRAFSMSEKDVEAFAATEWIATSSDAAIALLEDGPVHPRFYGAFPRKIRRYALDKKLLTLEQAIRVSTSLPASILGLKDRGVLRPGTMADVVVFDAKRIRDKADAFNPHQFAEGIEYVVVNGRLVIEQGERLGHLAGRVLSRANPRDSAERDSDQ